jgi:putative glycosyltransferase (TIGR04372 family)
MNLKNIILLILYTIPAFILKILNVRFPNFNLKHIGHLLAEPDCYVKEVKLGLTKKYHMIILAPDKIVANQAALNYWAKYFIIIRNKFLIKILYFFVIHNFTKYSVNHYISETNKFATFSSIQGKWNNNFPVLSINDLDNIRGKLMLKILGINENDWYICINSRDGGYRKTDESVHSFRNSNIEDFSLAITEVIKLGGKCINMGGKNSLQYCNKIDGLIDYAHHEINQDWLDLYISANCLFYLGDNSGPSIMSFVFGRRLATVNMAPLGTANHFGANDIGIPKLYKKIGTNNLLSFAEILNTEVGNFRDSNDFINAGIELINNTPEEILDLFIEQFLNIASTGYNYTIDDELLQEKYKLLITQKHYAYGSTSRIGAKFLKKYNYLLN